jgi:hypothetical protein
MFDKNPPSWYTLLVNKINIEPLQEEAPASHLADTIVCRLRNIDYKSIQVWAHYAFAPF